MYYKRKSVVLKYYMIVRHFYKKLHKGNLCRTKKQITKMYAYFTTFCCFKNHADE